MMSRNADNDCRLRRTKFDSFYRKRSDTLMQQDWNTGEGCRSIYREALYMAQNGADDETIRARVRFVFKIELYDKDLEQIRKKIK